MVFLHEFETRICFMNSRHEWALRAEFADAAWWRGRCSVLDACRAVWWGTPSGCVPLGLFASGGARYARTLGY